jgi:hypothetical protein
MPNALVAVEERMVLDEKVAECGRLLDKCAIECPTENLGFGLREC